MHPHHRQLAAQRQTQSQARLTSRQRAANPRYQSSSQGHASTNLSPRCNRVSSIWRPDQSFTSPHRTILADPQGQDHSRTQEQSNHQSRKQVLYTSHASELLKKMSNLQDRPSRNRDFDSGEVDSLLTTITTEAEMLINEAIDERKKAISALLPHFITTTTTKPSLLTKSATYKHHLAPSRTQWNLPPPLSKAELETLAATIHSEINQYINTKKQARLARIINTIQGIDASIDMALLMRCPVFRMQRQFWSGMGRAEMDVIIGMVLGQVGILRGFGREVREV